MLHHSWKVVLSAMESWHEGKLFIEHSLRIDHDALHILAGTLLWLVLAVALRRPLTWWRPWLAVLGLNVWNEAVDLTLEQWSDRGWQYGETAKDLVLTMALPTLLMFAARLRPALFGHHPGAARSRRDVRAARRG
jgi:hypothetical protein